MSTNIHLTRELEQFAKACVTEGRYNNVSEVVRSGLRLLQDTEARKQAFMDSLREAEAEADRHGWIGAESVLAEMDELIETSQEARRPVP